MKTLTEVSQSISMDYIISVTNVDDLFLYALSQGIKDLIVTKEQRAIICNYVIYMAKESDQVLTYILYNDIEEFYGIRLHLIDEKV